MFRACSTPDAGTMSATEWSDIEMAELLPTGTVTLLLADVEGSTRLWKNQPEEMTGAIARIESDGVRAHCRARRGAARRTG